jgi:hypothetical protein
LVDFQFQIIALALTRELAQPIEEAQLAALFSIFV